jgi:hypothetical protein
VALGAFGLDDDIDNRFFIRKILEDGTTASDALSNKLSDKRYKKLAAAFGFGDQPVPATQLSGFGDRITEAYKTRQFEIAVGEQDENMRLALGVRRELSEIAEKPVSDDTKWLTVMGNPPLRKVFETALNLPDSFGTLDLDLQLGAFKEKTENAFGSDLIDQFLTEEKQDDLVRLFLLRSDAQNYDAGLSSRKTALVLLQSSTVWQNRFL